MAKTPASKKSPTPHKAPVKGGRPAGLFTWLAVGLVVVVVAALVIIKVTGGSTTSGGSTGFQATDATTVAELTTIPASVFNTIGVTSPVAKVTAPSVLKGQPAFTGTTASGKTLPEVFYLGAEYCPYCAAQRWSTIIALSRFGTFHNLGNTTSGSQDVYPSTPTFTFVKATYTSKYLIFKSIEQNTNIVDSATGFYTTLQKMNATQIAEVTKYDTSKYIAGETSQDNGSIPFITFGNKFLEAGASYTPAALQNLTRSQIASALSDPTSPVTEAIIASANYQTAALCVLTNNQPANVCASAGVMVAKKAMGITK